MSTPCQTFLLGSFCDFESHSSLRDSAPLMQVMDLELEILDVWEKDDISCERVRNRCGA